jgi:hypothetical protein
MSVEDLGNLGPGVASGVWDTAKGVVGAADTALDVATRPGEAGIFKALNAGLGKIPPGVALALAVGLPLSYFGMRDTAHDANMLRTYDRAENRGNTPMSDETFTSFMQRRKHGEAQLEKTANLAQGKGIAGLAAAGAGQIGDLIKKLQTD